MKTKFTIFIFLFYTFLFSQPKGNLFIIGGGQITKDLIKSFVTLAGGGDKKFLIIPMASGEPEESAKSFSNKLIDAGCKNIEIIISDRDSIDSEINLNKLKGAKGIFFTGGDQSRLTRILLGSKLLDEIKKIYFDGGTIGGTSAGAAVMSKVMITGDEKLNKDSLNSFIHIKKDNIITSEGFGFLDGAIIDQHFIKRKRHNRLISVVLENPKLLGIGIDESTAIIVKGNMECEVKGESLVMILDASGSKIKETKNKDLAADKIVVRLLSEGDKFNLKTKKMVK